MAAALFVLVPIAVSTAEAQYARDSTAFSLEDVYELEYAADPQIAPDGEEVVYVRTSMDEMEDRRRQRLWIVNAEGSGHRPLTDPETDASSPRWSPSGDRIAYVSSQGENGAEIYLRWMETGETTRLSQVENTPSGLSWSSSGDRLAFIMQREADEEPFAKMRGPPEGAEWAPSPEVVVKTYYRLDGLGDYADGRRQLFVLPAEGGTPRQVTSGTAPHVAYWSRPEWTLDGSALIVSGNRHPDWRSDPRNSDLYAVDLEAGGRTRAPTGPSYTDHALDSSRTGVSNLDYAANFEAFLEDRKGDRPFFFWYGATEPHRSYNDGQGLAAGKELADARLPRSLPDTPLVRSDVLDYYVELEHFDRHLERMLGELRRRGELDNTLVVVTSDHGMPFPRAKANGLYDASTRVPLAIAWPGAVPPGRTVRDLVSLTGPAPTFLEAAGLSVPEAMTGRSLVPVLTSEESGRTAEGREHVVMGFERHTWARPGGKGYPIRAIRTHDYLYVRNYAPERWPAGNPRFDSPHQGFYGDIDDSPTKTFLVAHQNDPEVAPFFEQAFEKRPAEELYDLSEDPGQIDNVAGDSGYRDAQRRLRREMEQYLRETSDPRMEGRDPWSRYPYYFGSYAERSAKGGSRSR